MKERLYKTSVMREVLGRHGFHFSKSLGQNFLIDKIALKKIVIAAKLSSEDTILEIGPGLGTLTIELAKKAKKVISVEKDKKICEVLADILSNRNIQNIQIINQDVLDSKFQILDSKYKIVSNLPYYITSPVIRKFLEVKNPPKEMILMVQKEVAQRICAKPPKMSILAVSVQFYSLPKIISYISKKSFWPQPKVDSAIIRITPKQISERKLKLRTFAGERAWCPAESGTSEPRTERGASPGRRAFRKLSFREQDFFKIVKAGFSSKRKQLVNSLSSGLKIKKETAENMLNKAKISPKARAETLTINNWIKLYENYSKK